MAHPAFTLRNPNRARALVFQFCLNNARGMHRADGRGYDFWAEQVLALDALNPEIAARLARGLDNWARFADAARRHAGRAGACARACRAVAQRTGNRIESLGSGCLGATLET